MRAKKAKRSKKAKISSQLERLLRQTMKGAAKTPRRAKRKPKTRVAIRPQPQRTEAVGMVVSPRGRDLAHPKPDWKPSPGMPQSKQDFFLTSRAIRTMAYDYKKRILQIQYQNGSVYNYFDVPELTWIALKNAPSKGRYVYYNIRTSFKYTRVK